MKKSGQEGLKPLIGKVDILKWDNETGDLIEEDYGENLFLQNGMDAMLEAFTVVFDQPGTEAQYVVRQIKLGKDVGTGNPVSPQDPQIDDGASTQEGTNGNNIVLTLNPGDLTPTRPNKFTVRFTGELIGDNILDPNENSRDYTSLGMYTGNGTLVAFRRFSQRSITRGSRVEIRWTLFFEGQ